MVEQVQRQKKSGFLTTSKTDNRHEIFLTLQPQYTVRHKLHSHTGNIEFTEILQQNFTETSLN